MLVSIIGKARSGKDLSGMYLSHVINQLEARNRYKTVAFADPLKWHLMRAFNLSHEQLYGDLKEVEDVRYEKPGGGYWTPREMMQTYGQFMRTMDDQIWIRLLMEKLSSNTFVNYIITDVRYTNELEAVRKNGSLLIHVKRNNRPEVGVEGHTSETSLDNYDINPDFLIDNDGSKEDLYKKLDEVIKYINKGDFRYGN